MEHVDTRGVWPIYVRNGRTVRLEGQPIDITLDAAREIADQEFARQDRECLTVKRDDSI